MKMKNDSSSNEHESIDADIKKHDHVPEAVLQDLVRAYDKIDVMTLKEVTDKLKCFHLDTQGSENKLRETLRTSYKKILLNGMNLSKSNKLLPYYVVIDFEATCDESNRQNYRHEIIEFPAVLVDSKKQAIVDHFQMYCKPQINPTISKFCTELTGITQEQVDSAETFDKVLGHFNKWLMKHQLGSKNNFCVVTDGPWDMCRFLFSQCNYSKMKFPKWGNKWVNLKRTFSKFYKCERFSLTDMLEHLDIKFVGRHHCGLDDAKNIARILLKMIYDGANIQANERITGKKKCKEKTNRNKEPINDEVNESNNQVQFHRVEAYHKPIYYAEEMASYKRKRRERIIAETQLARKILKDLNSARKKSTSST